MFTTVFALFPDKEQRVGSSSTLDGTKRLFKKCATLEGSVGFRSETKTNRYVAHFRRKWAKSKVKIHLVSRSLGRKCE